jgi:hypothetical protein
MAILLRGFEPGMNLLRFVMLAVIVIPLCFAVAYLVRRIPAVSKVI